MRHREIRIGLVGCGRIARHVHLHLLERMAGVRIVAVADHTLSNLAAAAKLAPRAMAFSGLTQMLAVSDLDAVVVCLPTDLHAEAAEAVFAACKHLYLESPLAESLPSGRRVLAAWRRSGKVGMAGLNARFHPLFASARRNLASGCIGQLVAARTVFSSLPNSRPLWARRPERGGGPVFDKASHEADLLRYVLSREVEEVFTQAGENDPETVAINLRFAGGCVAQILVSTASVEDARLDVYGAAGRLSVDRYASLRPAVFPPKAGGFLRRILFDLREISAMPMLVRKLAAPVNDFSFRLALERFVASVRGEAEPWPDLLDGFLTLAVVVAAYESMISGRPIAPETGEEAHED